MIKSTAMQVSPRTVSHIFVSLMLDRILIHISTNVLPVTLMLRISFIWDVTMISATADVKPDDTGPDTKSMMKPKKDLRFRKVSLRLILA